MCVGLKIITTVEEKLMDNKLSLFDDAKKNGKYINLKAFD